MSYRRSIWILVSLLGPFASAAELPQQEAEDFLRALIAAHTRDTSGTMSLVLRAEVDQPDPSEAEITRRIRIQENALLNLLRTTSNERVRQDIERALAENADNVRAQVLRNADFHLDGTYQRAGPYWGGDERWSFRIQHPAQPEDPLPVEILQRFVSPRDVTCVTFDSHASTAVVSTTPASLRIPNPGLLGRLPPSLLDGLRATLPESSPPANPTDSLLLEVSVSQQSDDRFQLLMRTRDGASAECEVDAGRDYVCRRLAFNDEHGDLMSLMECSTFFRSREDGLWIPGSATITTYAITEIGPLRERPSVPPTDGHTGSFNPTERWILTPPQRARAPTTIVISVDEDLSAASPRISKTPLTITLPAGTTVILREPEPAEPDSFELNCAVDISIDTAWNVAKHPCRRQGAAAAAPNRMHVIHHPTAWWRWALIAVNVCLLIGFFAFWVRKKGRRQAALLLVVAVNAGMIGGCSDSTTFHGGVSVGRGESVDNGRTLIDVDPTTVDLARLSSAAETFTLPLRLTNRSQQRCELRLSTGCGCIRLSPTTASLEAGQHIEATLMIDTFGRRGPFEQTVVIQVGANDAVSTILVPVRGEFLRSVTALPDRVVLSVVSGQTIATGRVALQAPVELVEHLNVTCADERVESIVLTDAANGTVNCNITARAEGSAVYEPLHIVLSKVPPIRVLTVPMFRIE